MIANRQPVDAVYEELRKDIPRKLYPDITYLDRPSADETDATSTGAGRLYRLSISIQSASFDYDAVLKSAWSQHQNVAHIMLHDSWAALTVTLPAKNGTSIVIEIAREFIQACAMYTTLLPGAYRGAAKQAEAAEESDQIAAYYAPLDELASRWPHYVLSPSHPLTVQENDQPWSVFDARS
jgi:hypothetical protein